MPFVSQKTQSNKRKSSARRAKRTNLDKTTDETMKKVIVYNEDQDFCCDCQRPINKKCQSSAVMQGKCGKCYRMNFKENERRNVKKNRTKNRNNQRSYKSLAYDY